MLEYRWIKRNEKTKLILYITKHDIARYPPSPIVFFLFFLSQYPIPLPVPANAVDRPSQTDKSEDASTIPVSYSDNPLSDKQQSETAIGLTEQVSEITNTS